MKFPERSTEIDKLPFRVKVFPFASFKVIVPEEYRVPFVWSMATPTRIVFTAASAGRGPAGINKKADKRTAKNTVDARFTFRFAISLETSWIQGIKSPFLPEKPGDNVQDNCKHKA